jgi:hypothetical protein
MLTLCYTRLSVFSENKLFNMLIDFFMMQMLSTITAIDDLNYPEKTETYFIVNAPYVFSACWKVVKPLLQERTKRKIKVLYGSGRDELLKVNIINLFYLPLTFSTY